LSSWCCLTMPSIASCIGLILHCLSSPLPNDYIPSLSSWCCLAMPSIASCIGLIFNCLSSLLYYYPPLMTTYPLCPPDTDSHCPLLPPV
jgi:hypothetical protein